MYYYVLLGCAVVSALSLLVIAGLLLFTCIALEWLAKTGSERNNLLRERRKQ